MSQVIRIGTRGSKLALWQASLVEKELTLHGINCAVVTVESEGDQQQDKPLHEIGGVGLFTRMLDEAMRRSEIDIAVHSLKDVPTELPEDIVQMAVLPRGDFNDILVYKSATAPDFADNRPAVIATGSLRRKAQWLSRYPHHTVVGLRGNVQTRLRKLAESDWLGAIFARAGLERVNELPANSIVLDWMVPAPAQGAIMVTARLQDTALVAELRPVLNHPATERMVAIERDFMRTLEGGCTSPIGAHAQLEGKKVVFKGGVYSINGERKVEVNVTGDAGAQGLGVQWAREVLAQGGEAIIEEIRKSLTP